MTNILRSVDVARADVIADVQPVTIHRHENGEVSLVGQWPDVTAFSDEILAHRDTALLTSGVGIDVSHWPDITITLTHSHALYRVKERRPDLGVTVAELVGSS